MSNATWLQLTNNILRQATLPEITQVNFDLPSGSGGLTRYQSAAKEFIRNVHEIWSVDLPTDFARREMQLPLQIGQSVYPLDIGISAESITFDSFRCDTPGSAGRLNNWTYEYFSRRYADQTLIYTGAPTHYILLPVDRTQISPLYQVNIFPIPDQQYMVKYMAQLNAYQLQLSSDQVLWAPEYNHVLEGFARSALEDILGEGKGASATTVAMRAYQIMRQKAGRSAAERKKIRMQQMYTRRRSLGYYPSPNDADAPYYTPDSIR